MSETTHSTFESGILDALQSMICILERDGNIIYANKSWKEYSYKSDCLIGANESAGNYFEMCRSAVDKGDDYALKIILGIRKVLDESESRVYLTYSKELESGKKWFSLTITSFDGEREGVILTFEDITASLRKSEALREAEQLYRQQFDQSITGIIIGTPEGEIIDANPSACSILGYSRSQLIAGGREMITDMAHPKNRLAYQIRREESRYEGEKVYLHESGREIPVEVSSVLYRNQNGRVISINNFKDLTDRKNTENELKRERDFRKAAESSIPGIFFILDKQGAMIDWNNAFRDELGYDLDEIPGINAIDFIADHDKEDAMKKIHQVFSDGEAETVVQVKRKDNSLRYQRLRGKKFRSKNGDYLVGTGVDITEAVFAETEKNRALEMLNQLFENSPIGIVMVNGRDMILKANPSFKKMFGYADELVDGRKLDKLITPKIKSEESILNSDRTFQGLSLQMETVRSKKDGTKIPVMINSVPIRSDDDVTAIYGMYVDLTGQKEMAVQIKSLLESEKTVRVKVEKALLEKNILLQEVHHRVKNNMAVVTGLLELQIMDDEDPKVIKKLREVQGRIYAIAKIHETLYSEEEVVDIRFDKYLESLLVSIPAFQYLDNIPAAVKLTSDEFTLNLNQAVPAGLIINEILNSSVDEKRAENHSLIEVNVKVVNNEVEILLKGISLNTEYKKNRFDSDKFQYKLIEILSLQLEASLNIHENATNQIKITFKKAAIKGSSSSILKSEELL